MNEKKSSIPVSFLMLTFNEEINLPNSLPLLSGWADDIVIVDSFSTDRTLEIAARYGARVFQNKFPGHARQWLWGMQNTGLKHDWVFMFDPDHRLTPELKLELEELFRQGVPSDVNGFYVNRRNVFRGKWIRHGCYYPKYMLKLIRKSLASFDEHEFDYRVYVPGRTLQLRNDIIEENLKEEKISFWVEKHNGFALKQAEEEMFRAANPKSWKTTPLFWGNADQRTLWLKIRWYRLPLFIRPFLYFFYRYFLRLGFLDGGTGFLFHFLQAFWYRIIVDMNIQELRRKSLR
jgi:glycosyltransferase involved in cell wall biosynthesis